MLSHIFFLTGNNIFLSWRLFKYNAIRNKVWRHFAKLCWGVWAVSEEDLCVGLPSCCGRSHFHFDACVYPGNSISQVLRYYFMNYTWVIYYFLMYGWKIWLLQHFSARLGEKIISFCCLQIVDLLYCAIMLKFKSILCSPANFRLLWFLILHLVFWVLMLW